MLDRAPRLAVPLIAALLFLSVGCGDSKSEPITQAEAQGAANHYYMLALGIFTGSTDANDFIGLFEPECRRAADRQTIAFMITFLQSLAPELRDIEVEAVDVGVMALEHTDAGTLVTPLDPSALRLKIDGVFVDVAEVISDGIFVPGVDDSEPILLVRREGGVLIGDCSDLRLLTTGRD